MTAMARPKDTQFINNFEEYFTCFIFYTTLLLYSCTSLLMSQIVNNTMKQKPN